MRAMPRRPLYALHGFTGKISIEVLSAVADEGWCATREAIAADVDSKEVRIGVVVARRGAAGIEVLAGPSGAVLHLADIPPEAVNLGDFKRLALAAAQAACPAVRSVEMAGYYNDDAHAEWRRVFVIVYRGAVPADAEPPAGMVWTPRGHLQGLDDAAAAIVAGFA